VGLRLREEGGGIEREGGEEGREYYYYYFCVVVWVWGLEFGVCHIDRDLELDFEY